MILKRIETQQSTILYYLIMHMCVISKSKQQGVARIMFVELFGGGGRHHRPRHTLCSYIVSDQHYLDFAYYRTCLTASTASENSSYS